MSYISLSNFSSLRFGAFMKPSLSIEKKLNNPKTTIDDLLIEQDIVQELKNQNQKLINFLTKDRVKELIDYIIIEPNEDDQIKGHLFPFTASELLNCEESKILDLFDIIDEDIVEKTRKLSILSVPENEEEKPNELFEKTRQDEFQEEERKSLREVKKASLPMFVRIELLDHLLSFIQTDKELNYVLVGYFSRLFSLILSRKPYKVINYLFFERDYLLERFVHHSYRRSMSDVLSKMLLFENFEENKDKGGISDRDQMNANTPIKGVTYDLESFKPKRLKMIEMIFQKMNFEEQNTEKMENLLSVLGDLIDNKAILTSIISEEKIITSLCNQLKYDTNANETFEVRSNYAQLIGFMIKLINNVIAFNLQVPSLSLELNSIAETELSRGLLMTLPFIITNFNIVNKGSLVSFEATFISQSLQLGNHRVKIMEFIACLFPYFKNIPSVYDNILINSYFFADALNYLVQFEWNNMYQQSFSLLFKNYLNEAKNHEELTKHIFDKQRLLNLIMECLGGEKFKFQSKQEINHGYHSFLVSLGYKINTIGGGESLLIPNHSREGSICFINKTNIQDNITNIAQISNPIKTNPTKVDVCASVNNYLNDSWNEFFLGEIGQTVKLYETRLCEKAFSPSLNDSVRSEEQEKDDILNNNSPFPSKDDNFFGTGEASSNEKAEESNYEMNSFPFAENVPQKEGIDMDNLKVDEVDTKNYNDIIFWKDALSKSNRDYLEDALKDLELE